MRPQSKGRQRGRSGLTDVRCRKTGPHVKPQEFSGREEGGLLYRGDAL